jgi:hypothetical protein
VRQLKAAEGSSRVLVTVSADVRQWLEERARYHSGTLGGEVVRSIRLRMEAEAAAKERATTAAPE